MIKIQLPINDDTIAIKASPTVEQHIIERFYPFGAYSYEQCLINCFLYIVEEQSVISVYREEVCIYQKGKTNEYETYKIIIELLRENIIAKGETTILHASFLNFFNKGILLIGGTGVGKSTLSAYLHSKEHVDCYTDDIVFIDFASNFARYSSQYIHIREPAISLLGSIPNIKYDSFISRYKLEVSRDRKPMKIDKIYLLHRGKEEVAFEKMADMPVVSLLHNMWLPYSVKVNTAAANHLGNTIPVCELHYCDLESAYRLMKDYNN